VVEWGRLLSGCWVFSSTEGSNPSLPAKIKTRADARVLILISSEGIINLVLEILPRLKSVLHLRNAIPTPGSRLKSLPQSRP
jgi:hypothetical protein